MCLPQVLAPVPQHNKVGCSSHLHSETPHSFVGHPPLPFPRGSVRRQDWGVVCSPRGGSAFPRPSSLRAGLGWPAGTLATCFRPCWPREAAAQRQCRAALSPAGRFTRTPPEPCLHPCSLPLPHSPVTALPHLRAQHCRPPGRSLPQGGQPCPGGADGAPAPWHIPASGGSPAGLLVRLPLDLGQLPAPVSIPCPGRVAGSGPGAAPCCHGMASAPRARGGYAPLGPEVLPFLGGVAAWSGGRCPLWGCFCLWRFFLDLGGCWQL